MFLFLFVGKWGGGGGGGHLDANSKMTAKNNEFPRYTLVSDKNDVCKASKCTVV